MEVSAGEASRWSTNRTKSAFRDDLLAARRRIGEQEHQHAAARVAAALAALTAGAPRVASYAPMAGEPRPPAIPGALLPVLLPDGDLDWARDGVPQGRDAIADVDLVLVPALAVDRAGVRLGRGGGSYDRALARTSARTVALLHDGELVDALPCEPHDIRVGWVVTPALGLVGLPL